MKKQQKISFAGKYLSRNEMKNLSGGGKRAMEINYYCGPDYETYCYPSLSQCVANCSDPSLCQSHRTGACV
jgi:hypothetical protein